MFQQAAEIIEVAGNILAEFRIPLVLVAHDIEFRFFPEAFDEFVVRSTGLKGSIWAPMYLLMVNMVKVSQPNSSFIFLSRMISRLFSGF